MRQSYILTVITLILLAIANLAFAQNEFKLSSSSFANNATLPTQFTCDGKDISPSLTWSGIPANTQSLALIVSDPDAPGGTFFHWVAFNIPTTITQLNEGANIESLGGITGKNSFPKDQYNGPCPPKKALHHYIFTLYALDTTLSLPPGADAAAAIMAMQKHIIKTTTVTATFSH